jgi:hypothetical protein
VVEDLPYAKAWCERPVTVVAQGASGDVTFRTRANGSGGRFLTTSATTGRATWAPGQSGGSGVVDRLEVEDARGRKAELTLTVMPNPVAHHVADFSSSDVWYVDVGRKFGSHGFATDFHDALAFLGLRSPTSRDATGTLADRLAALVVQRRILRELNMRFGRDADGRIGAGLPISFPIELPTGYERPAAGSWLTGGAGRYSVMGIHHANSTGVVGMAYQDGVGNDLHEHNTSGPSGELGVFVNHYVETVRMIYGDDLAEDPIGDADVAVLEALLYDLPTYGGRRDLIERTVRTFAKTTAELCAHEMGHSLGLQHTNPRTSRSLMNTAVFVSDEVNHFLPDDYEQLGRALPGAGRAGGVSKPGSFPNGVEACTLRLDPAQSRPLPLWAVPAAR